MDRIINDVLPSMKHFSSQPDSDDPKQLGRFSVLRVLGRGGMGTVYLGYDSSLDRHVAIKLIRLRYSGNKNFVQRFEREAKIIASINHPNIVHIHDWGNDPKYGSFIVLELVEGENAFERVTRDGPVTIKFAFQILKAVAEALKATHQQGIIHRDIKPGNILLTKNDSIKLTDLGIAKQIGKDGDQNLTGNHSPGTPGFMAPEQKRSLRLDIRADIYSLGKTFIFLLTGHSEFDFLLEKSKLLQNSSGLSTDDDSTADQKFLKTLLPIIRKMTAIDRGKRYHSPQALLKDLDQVEQVSVRGRNQRTRIAILTCTVFVLFGAAFFMGYPDKTKRPAPIIPIHQSPSKGEEGTSLTEIQEVVNTIRVTMKERSPQDTWTSPPAIIMILPMEFDPDIPRSEQKQFNKIPLGSAIKKFINLPVVERESLKFVLQEYNLEVSDLINPEARLRLGKMLPASILLENMLISLQSKWVLSAKIVNIESSEILEFVEAEAGISEPDSVDKLYQFVANKLADSIDKNLVLQGKIVSVNGDWVEINLGQYHGVKEGMKFQIRHPIETARGLVKAGAVVVTQGVVKEISKFSSTLTFEAPQNRSKLGCWF